MRMLDLMPGEKGKNLGVQKDCVIERCPSSTFTFPPYMAFVLVGRRVDGEGVIMHGGCGKEGEGDVGVEDDVITPDRMWVAW